MRLVSCFLEIFIDNFSLSVVLLINPFFLPIERNLFFLCDKISSGSRFLKEFKFSKIEFLTLDKIKFTYRDNNERKLS